MSRKKVWHRCSDWWGKFSQCHSHCLWKYPPLHFQSLSSPQIPLSPLLPSQYFNEKCHECVSKHLFPKLVWDFSKLFEYYPIHCTNQSLFKTYLSMLLLLEFLFEQYLQILWSIISHYIVLGMKLIFVSNYILFYHDPWFFKYFLDLKQV